MRFWVAVGTTLVAHGALAFAITQIETRPVREVTVIQVVTRKPKPPKPPAPPKIEPPTLPDAPPVAPPKAPPPKPAVAKPPPPPSPAPTTAPPSTSSGPAAPPAFDVKLGGTGGGTGAPTGGTPAPIAPPVAPPPEHKKLAAPPEAKDACADPIVKPKPIKVVQPAFTQDAQDAGITGKVRVEIAISATGEITGVKVIDGLGHGLDEAALEAARASAFTPATHCGEPVATTFVIGMRFQK